MTITSDEKITVKLSLSEWLKAIAAVVIYTLAVYGFVDGVRDDLTNRVVVLEEKAQSSRLTNERLSTIEADVKKILEKLPR